MAINRVLKSTEKEILVDHSGFRIEVEWALKNFASYWSDPAAAAAQVVGAGFQRAAINHIYCSRIIANQSIVSSNIAGIAEDFIMLAKGMNLVDDGAGFDPDVVVAYMAANAKFDELADLYVKLKTPTPLGF